MDKGVVITIIIMNYKASGGEGVGDCKELRVCSYNKYCY